MRDAAGGPPRRPRRFSHYVPIGIMSFQERAVVVSRRVV